MNGAQGNLHAGKIDVVPRTRRRTACSGSRPTAGHGDGRQALTTGDALNYAPADEKYVDQGAPVKMIDADCQETTRQDVDLLQGVR